jgi:hypothetical protein
MRWGKDWRHRLTGLVLVLWGLQVIWLAWYFAPDIKELALRIARGQTGPAIRQEDPFYRWLMELAAAIPPGATYIFLDNYEAGKEIQARYHLTLRRHILHGPQLPPSFLFYAVRREGASALIIRESGQALGPGAQAAAQSPAFQRLELPGPGLVFRVDPTRLKGVFFD